VTFSSALSNNGSISLASSNSQVASVPATVSAAAGASSVTFPVTTQAVTSPVSVTITATYSGTSKDATLNVTAAQTPSVVSLTLAPSSVPGGGQVQGTVTLSNPAPTGGAVVSLSSDDRNGVITTLPPTVTVQVGATAAQFTVSTRAVGGTFQINISAAYGGTSTAATLTVLFQPPPPLVVLDQAGRLAAGFDILVNTDQGRTNWLSSAGSEGLQAAYPSGQVFGFIAVVISGNSSPGSRPGRDLSAYRTLQIQLRGANGNESVGVGIKDNLNPDDGTEVKSQVTLSSHWQTITIPISTFSKSDPTRLYTVCELVLNGSIGETIYFRDIEYVY